MLSPQQIRQAHFNAEFGYGSMGLTWTPKPAPKEQAFAAIHKAIEMSKKPALINMGEFYGPDFSNLRLLGEFFKTHPGLREKVIVSCKGCMDNATLAPRGDRAGVLSSVENCVRAFGGPIDVFEPARIDTELAGSKPYAPETFDALVECIEKGLIGAISLSEVTEEQIRAIDAKYHQYVCCVEIELSLFSPHILSNGIAAACNELGLPMLCYSPLCRGLLTGHVTSSDDVPDGDFKKCLKKFNGDALKHNLLLPQFLQQEIVAKHKGAITLPQVALAWIKALNAKYPKTNFIPIPGGSSAKRVEENFTLKELSEQELDKIDDFIKHFQVQGDRYEVA
ncbi:LANO_0H18184g1_1 [Lachancea nothofagi CBS 11611]|uniref:LANO_0H18184g1_1 n=1 Tax=Lachancea nothofagi CBS 11611 TaxID=1266666 RepID=A0A1G4KMY9_9SACH|nr:LANO_0H18184g1_1 [Lachancea nothofagi CBS 11611]